MHSTAIPLTRQAFILENGHPGSDTVVYKLADFTAAFTYSPNGTQTIQISRHGKHLINYIRAMDIAVRVAPAPQLIITGTDTVICFNLKEQNFLKNICFQIKNNKATSIKTVDTAGPVN